MNPMKDTARSQTPRASRPGATSALRTRLARLRPSVPQAWQERFNAFWSARNPREQAILAGGGAVLALVIGYLVLWEPAADGRERLARNLPKLRADLAEMETLAQEARGLKATPAPSLRGDALTQALQDSLGQHGLKATRLAAGADNSVQVQLDKVPFGAVSGWLQDVRQQQRMKVIDARIVYVGATALVNVSATLQGPGGRS
ncbi:type II secretion system protein M [Cupriavidus necator]|uniref:Type II secretion system protein M n=1 Tax=Cupriavidus necator TaxID=106590 RepID=A0A367PNV3_CUPNE|nr:type II secretion system protein M [Cupriavidus necator]QQX84217.1 type II secretion system protein M [Cupriavidus necator]RCJ08716.1 type II secretion system protein M [Cupriavidus necator]